MPLSAVSTRTLAGGHLVVVYGLEFVHLPLFQHLLLALTEIATVFLPIPPRHVLIVGVRILRF
jgi:hypothetical protein